MDKNNFYQFKVPMFYFIEAYGFFSFNNFKDIYVLSYEKCTRKLKLISVSYRLMKIPGTVLSASNSIKIEEPTTYVFYVLEKYY